MNIRWLQSRKKLTRRNWTNFLKINYFRNGARTTLGLCPELEELATKRRFFPTWDFLPLSSLPELSLPYLSTPSSQVADYSSFNTFKLGLNREVTDGLTCIP